MRSTLDTCNQNGAYFIRGTLAELVEVLQDLNTLNVAAFVTRYEGNGENSSGVVSAVNYKFLADCGNDSSAKYLGKTYAQIHPAAVAQKFTDGERAVMQTPLQILLVDEGPGVDVVKVAIPSGSLGGEQHPSAVTYVLGVFKAFPDRHQPPAELDPGVVAAQNVIRSKILAGATPTT